MHYIHTCMHTSCIHTWNRYGCRCNYSARTSDLSREFQGTVSGYAVSFDVCVHGTKDVYVISGGTRAAAWEKYDEIRVRMVSARLVPHSCCKNKGFVMFFLRKTKHGMCERVLC